MKLLVIAVLCSWIAMAQAQEAKEWNMLVFLNGHNNLDSFGKQDINEMEMAGSNEKMNIIVQWASYANSEKTKRLVVQKDENRSDVTSPIVQELPRVDMGDYKQLVDFIVWAQQNYPSKNIFVDVWNHGSGWHKNNLQQKDISNDDFTGNKITTAQLGLALREASAITGQRIAIYGSDACLMQMIEVAGEIADSSDIMIGSQDLEPGAGWHYGDFLNAVYKSENYEAENISKILVDTYAASYDNGSQGRSDITLSAIRLNHYQNLKNSLNSLALAIQSISPQEKQNLKSNLNTVMRYYYSDYADLMGVLNSMAKNTTTLNAEIEEAKSILQSMIIHNRASGYFMRSAGLSIWAPKSASQLNNYSSRYLALDFGKTEWTNFLKFLFL